MSKEYHKKELKYIWVVWLSIVTLLVKIIFGITTNSIFTYLFIS